MRGKTVDSRPERGGGGGGGSCDWEIKSQSELRKWPRACHHDFGSGSPLSPAFHSAFRGSSFSHAWLAAQKIEH